jgi:hypothetical protein
MRCWGCFASRIQLREDYAIFVVRRALTGAAISVGVAAVLAPGKGWMGQATAAGIHCAFNLHTGKYSSSCWLARCKSVHTTPHMDTQLGTPP